MKYKNSGTMSVLLEYIDQPILTYSWYFYIAKAPTIHLVLLDTLLHYYQLILHAKHFIIINVASTRMI